MSTRIDLHVKKEKYWFTVKVNCAETDLTGMQNW